MRLVEAAGDATTKIAMVVVVGEKLAIAAGSE